jgi:hypothetical protein
MLLVAGRIRPTSWGYPPITAFVGKATFTETPGFAVIEPRRAG